MTARRRLPLLALALAGSLASPRAAGLTVRVRGIHPPEGILRVSLFRAPEGYPEEFPKAARTLSKPISDSADSADAALTVRFDSLEPGAWAVAVLHDRNGNSRLDRNLLGVPKEGIGASNGATRRLGAPRFADARFTLPDSGLALEIVLRYW